MRRDIINSTVILFFLLITLPLAVFLVGKVAEIRKQAAGIPANITVDARVLIGDLKRPWEALAQGGERETFLTDSTTQRVMRNLKTKYVRIDHLYGSLDGINVVTGVGGGGNLSYNWSSLDKRVNAILSAGALPFFSLSYMPSAISSGNETSAPRDYRLWQTLVRDTVEHFSGTAGRNLSDVYYEVWNEPDLFGEWKFNNGESGKSYLLLYKYASLGAASAASVNRFFVGGPATTEPRSEFLSNFLSYTSTNNLRVDFISWHRYHKRVSQFTSDLDAVDTWVSAFPQYTSLPRIISEWGSDPGVSPWHDSFFDAAHYVSSVRQFLDRLELVFFFEVKDGVKEDGGEIPGRWGVVSHYGRLKPKYHTMELLPRLSGKRVLLTGEGTNVTGFAANDNGRVSLILVNFDPSYSHSESVPVVVNGLSPSSYSISQTVFSSSTPTGLVTSNNQELSGGSFSTILPMLPNTVVFITFDPLSPLSVFTDGKFGYDGDKAIQITEPSSRISLPLGSFDLNKGSVEFWLRPRWEGLDGTSTFFEIPLTDNKVFGAYRRMAEASPSVEFGLFGGGNDFSPINTVSATLPRFDPGTWQHFLFSWQNFSAVSPENTSGGGTLKIFLNKNKIVEGNVSLRFGLYDSIVIGARKDGTSFLSGDVDELRISKIPRIITGFSILDQPYSLDSDTFVLRHFDGNLD